MVGGLLTWKITERPRFRTRVDPTRFVPEDDVQAAVTAYDAALKVRLQYVPQAKAPANDPKEVLDLDDETSEDEALKKVFEESDDE